MTEDEVELEAQVAPDDDEDATVGVVLEEGSPANAEPELAVRSGVDLLQVVAFRVLPAAAIILGAFTGFLMWESFSAHKAHVAADESVAAARDTTVAILSYQADSANKELNAARDRLTGSFLDAYTKLINEVVIPGAREKKITAVADVPAAASVSAAPSHAVALVFVNQSTTIGNDAPTNTASSVRVTLDKVDGRWLVSGFDPI